MGGGGVDLGFGVLAGEGVAVAALAGLGFSKYLGSKFVSHFIHHARGQDGVLEQGKLVLLFRVLGLLLNGEPNRATFLLGNMRDFF